MSNLYLELDDIYRDYCKPAIANKITTTEVTNKIGDVKIQCTALRSYMLCFEREWGFPTEYYVKRAEQIIDELNELEAYFRREVPNDLSKLISAGEKAI